jgi:hypothetical protein
MRSRAAWLILPTAIAAWAAATYGLAKAGEPQSLWIWKNVLGVIV